MNSEEHYFAERPEAEPRLGLVRTTLRGRFFEFFTSSGVFSGKRIDLGTRLLVESMLLPEEGCVLDLGCGYGAVGIAAAAFNPDLQVILVDINARAVKLARMNVRRNNIKNVDVRRGFLYEPVRGLEFDAILCNPPVSAGMQTVLRIIHGATAYLKAEGLFELVVRSKIGSKRFPRELEKALGSSEVLARQSGYRVLLSKALKQVGR
jgi:16S rRNA G1207 methylase RsmC